MTWAGPSWKAAVRPVSLVWAESERPPGSSDPHSSCSPWRWCRFYPGSARPQIQPPWSDGDLLWTEWYSPSTPASYMEVLNPSTSKCDFIWSKGLYRGIQAKGRPSGWDPIQHDWCPYEKRKLDIKTWEEKRQREESWRKMTISTLRWRVLVEDDHLYTKERGLEQTLPSRPSQGNSPCLDLGCLASRTVRQ